VIESTEFLINEINCSARFLSADYVRTPARLQRSAMQTLCLHTYQVPVWITIGIVPM